MRTKITLLFLISCIFGHAQTPDCVKKQAVIDSLVSSKNLSSAFELWMTVRECEAVGESYYISGQQILRHRLEAAPAAEHADIRQQLVTLFDTHDQKFPLNQNGNSLQKAMLLQSGKDANPEQVLALLDNYYLMHRDKFTDVSAIYAYYDLFYSKFLADDSNISPDAALAKLEDMTQHIQRVQSSANASKQPEYANLLRSIEALSSELLNCENLEAYYMSRFEGNKINANWLVAASERLNKSRCYNNSIYTMVSEAAYSLEPSSASAYNMGLIAYRKNQPSEAARYFTQSADLNKNNDEKAATYFMVASTVYASTDKASAKQFATKAINAQPKFGKAYLLLANLYAGAGAQCGRTEFEQKAVYWLAADAAKKAGTVDPQFKKGADKLAESYLAKVPSDKEIRSEKKGGKTVTFGCWINESVKVPKI